jgi:catechol-2,3-dioxygenase
MERFYCDLIGFRVVWRPDPDNVYLSSHGAGDNLALHADPAAARADTRLDHLGVVVPAPADVDAWAEHLRRLGAAPEAPPRDHRDGSRSFYVRDPEGNRLQVIHLGPSPAEREQPSPAAPGRTPRDAPAAGAAPPEEV